MTVQLLAREFAFADTPDVCLGLGLDWRPGGYGMLFCEAVPGGGHWTAITPDPTYLRMIISANGTKILSGLEMPAEKFPLRRPGWPDEW